MSSSTSTTTVTIPQRTRQVQPPRDYDLLLSGGNASPSSSSTTADTTTAVRTAPREGWTTDYRDVPEYRPVNRELDFATRPNGSSAIESVFITTMFTGVNLIAAADAVWRSTGGRINTTYFKYKIGGEW